MIEIMEKSEGSLLAVRFSGTLTAEDYTDVWIPACKEVIADRGKVRVLMYMDETFDGWEAAVVWEDTKFGLKNLSHFEKIAVVGGSEWMGKLSEMFGSIIPGLAVKAFATGELEEAHSWIL